MSTSIVPIRRPILRSDTANARPMSRDRRAIGIPPARHVTWMQPAGNRAGLRAPFTRRHGSARRRGGSAMTTVRIAAAAAHFDRDLARALDRLEVVIGAGHYARAGLLVLP